MGYFFENKKPSKIAILLGLIAGLFLISLGVRLKKETKMDFSQASKRVIIVQNGVSFEIEGTKAQSVRALLEEQKIEIGENDFIFPGKETSLISGAKIIINQARKVIISDRNQKIEGYVLGVNVADALEENKIELGEDDLISPSLWAAAQEGIKIQITRVLIKEEKEYKNIDFKKTIKEDSKLSWREKKVEQKGILGKKELTYKTVYYNDKIISRKLIEEEIVTAPVEEISIQGTYVKLGKAHDGMASWYAFRGGMFAANPWLPIGSFVKVTNVDNGKSVIVKINDRGPFVPGRIIDLDKIAFQKIASLGAGVAHIKMEEILN